MPRHADPQLEERILSSAERLWHKGGDEALTMRAVARAARTTTPTVYQRFRNREDILRALVVRTQERLLRDIEPSRSLEDLCHRILVNSRTSPHDYELLGSDLITRLKHPRPNLEFALKSMSEWFGGRPQDHYPMFSALWSLLQGAFTLMKILPAREADVVQASTETAIRILIQNRALFANTANPGEEEETAPAASHRNTIA